MLHERLFLYYFPDRTDGVNDIVETARQLKLDLVPVNLKDSPDKEAEVLGWVDSDREMLPLLRIGDEKIRGFFFAPRGAILIRLFGNTLDERAAPTGHVKMYTTSSCGACRMLKQWLTTVGQEFEEVNIGEVDGAADDVIRWSGGRRVVPTVEFEQTARLFNPGIPLMSRYLAKR